MAGLHGVVRADSQHRAGVAARPISHHDHARPVVVWNAPQVFLCELKREKKCIVILTANLHKVNDSSRCKHYIFRFTTFVPVDSAISVSKRLMIMTKELTHILVS